MLFPSETIDILKLDFFFEAGTFYQPCPLCATATNSLFPVATSYCDARRLAEFLDHRGILIDTGVDLHTSVLTAYLLPRYAEDFFPLLRDILTDPAFPDDEVDAYRRRTALRLTTNFQRTAYVARNLFCRALYGDSRPEGKYARPADVERITPELLHSYFRQHYSLPEALCSLSGHYSDKVLHCFQSCFGNPDTPYPVARLQPVNIVMASQRIRHQLEPLQGADDSTRSQASIRVGRLLPFSLTDADYAPFQVLSMLLGGYFGSRLMRNIREDKGYTYGISCRVRTYRTSVYFEIVSDVAADTVDAALDEIYKELNILSCQLVDDEELMLVRNYMEGEYLRAIDGIFERADRTQQLLLLGVDEHSFTQTLLHAIRNTSASQLQQLAQCYLSRNSMTEVVVC